MSDTTFASGDRTVTAFFDTGDHAATAKFDLIAAGVPANAITIVGSVSDPSLSDDHRPRGFWESLTGFFMPDDDRRTYAEGLRRGGFALSVQTSATLYDTALDILDRDGAVDLDERESIWESEGWSRSRQGIDNLEVDPSYRPADASTAGFGGSRAGEDGLFDQAPVRGIDDWINTAGEDAPMPVGGPPAGASAAGPLDDGRADIPGGRKGDIDSPLGRRDLTHGKTRVRSYVVEGDVNR